MQCHNRELDMSFLPFPAGGLPSICPSTSRLLRPVAKTRAGPVRPPWPSLVITPQGRLGADSFGPSSSAMTTCRHGKLSNGDVGPPKLVAGTSSRLEGDSFTSGGVTVLIGPSAVTASRRLDMVADDAHAV